MIVRKKLSETIKSVLSAEGTFADKVILFGSRATGSFSDESDWDILIVLHNDISGREKRQLAAKIRMAIHDRIEAVTVDIILVNNDVFLRDRGVINTISNEAFSGGVLL